MSMENFLRWLKNKKLIGYSDNDILLEKLLEDEMGNRNIARIKWGDGTGPLIKQEIRYIGN